MEDPLDFIDFDDVIQHGDPNSWTLLGEKAGSGLPTTSSLANPGTLKIYEIYEDVHGDQLEVHYFRHADGTVGDVKVRPRT